MPATALVPMELDGSRWDQVEPILDALAARPLPDRAAVEAWLIDRSELEAACAEASANLYINMTCNTADADAQRAFTAFVTEVAPRLKPRFFELDTKQVEAMSRLGMEQGTHQVLARNTRAGVEIYRDENVPIQTELELLSQRYQQLTGAMTVDFDGRERTLPEMGVYQESTDRAARERAWRAVASRRLDDRDAIDELYDQMIALRDRVGTNAGFPGYTGYAFRSMLRFDYGPAQCRDFHDACARAVAPAVARLDESRRRALGVRPMRPWDLGVDPKGRPSLKPFSGGRELVAKSVRAMRGLDERLARMLATLGDGSNTSGARGGACLDLDTRKDKAPGGYQQQRERSRTTFIFMNAAGLQRDVETMVHEAGHAFHSMLCAGAPLLHDRNPPIEFAEVASMSMELLTAPHWGGPDGFYPDSAEHARAMRAGLEHTLERLPWIAAIDAFQHWVYDHPGHARTQRESAWLEIDERFGRAVSWDGLDEIRRSRWQAQIHLFGYPFYYIEYGIAQLGALQLWLHAKEKGEASAIESYLAALRLGGSRPLPELFRAAGLVFDFGYDTVSRLTERVERELESLPE